MTPYRPRYRKVYADSPEQRFRNAARKAAQRAHPVAGKCSVCGGKKMVVRHHADYSKPLEIIFVCKRCHWKLDRLHGHGIKLKKIKNCKVCGASFDYNHSRQKTCLKPACIQAIYKANSDRLWKEHREKKQEFTGLQQSKLF